MPPVRPSPHALIEPTAWPSVWQWMSHARADPLALFPTVVYDRLRVDRALFGRHLVMVSDPEAIAHVCGQAASSYRLSNLHLRMLGPVLGSGLTVAKGRHWMVQRRLAGRLMPRQHDEARVLGLNERVDRTLDDWARRAFQGRPIECAGLADDLVALSIDLLAQALFAHDADVASPAVIDAVRRHRACAERPDMLDLLGATPRIGSPRMRRSHEIAHGADDEIACAIGQAQARRAAAAGTAVPASAPLEFSRDFVVSLIAGFESMTSTCLWLLRLAAHDPALQETLHAVGTRHAGHVVPERDRPGDAMDAAIAETLRLYPPLPIVFRTALVDDETPLGPIGRGSLVCISPWVVHRHRRLWTDPDRFDLDRQHAVNPELRAFMPFGVGARRCIGMHVGNHLVRLIVSLVLQRFDVAVDRPDWPAPRFGMSLRPAAAFGWLLRERVA